MARGGVAGTAFDERGHFGCAEVLRFPAACAKPTTGGWGSRVRDVAAEDNALTPTSQSGVGDGHCRQQRLDVRMRRATLNLACLPGLDDLAEVHDRHAVGDLADDGQVVRDEEVGD